MQFSFKENLKNFVEGVKENKIFTLRIALMAACALSVMPDSVTYAQSLTDGTSVTVGGVTANGNEIGVLTGPLARVSALMQGPVPKAIVTIGAVIGGASWAMNIENQIVKTAMRVVGGGSVSLAAATFINQSTSFLIP